jgi:hypothetical protein
MARAGPLRGSMKILFVGLIKYLSPFSGGSKANQLLLEHLAARHHSCRVLTTSFPTEMDTCLNDLSAQGIKVSTSPSGLPRYSHRGVEGYLAGNLLQLGSELVGMTREFEPTWTITSDLHLAEIALEASPSRVIYIAHSAATLPFGPDCAVVDSATAKLLGRMAGILTVSKYMANYIRQWGGLESTSIYWPAYGSGPFPCYGTFDQGYVTMVNTAPSKGLPIFLELAGKLPDVEFALVPTRALTDEARSELTQSANVRLLQPQEDINKIFARTRILLAPSLCAESFGQIVVDAMLRGIPVLGSNLGGIPEAKLGIDYVLPVRQSSYEKRDSMNYTAAIPEQDVGPWQAALEELLTNRARYEQVAADSRAAALKFIARLGFDPFEAYLEKLPVLSTVEQAENSEKKAERVELQQRLSHISPERRALLALRLRKQQGVALQQTDFSSNTVSTKGKTDS